MCNILMHVSMAGFQRFKQALGFNPKSGSDLKNEVKRLMFSQTGDKEPIPVSSDDARFIMVMSAFTVYEKQVSLFSYIKNYFYYNNIIAAMSYIMICIHYMNI